MPHKVSQYGDETLFQVKLIKKKDGKTRVVNIGPKYVLSPVKLGNGATYRCQAKHCGQRTVSEELELIVISNAVLDPMEEIKTCKVNMEAGS